ncbi:MAG: hypothetical protein IKV35_04560, partial [Clostridia bacterium]|nr:hypothetical protein [Clostridia bacterium]
VEAFGDFERRWFNAVRGKEPFFLERGRVTYYTPFLNRWRTDDFVTPTTALTVPLGDSTRTYRYNPAAPASFKGGLSANFGGTAWQDAPNSRYDILSFFTDPFEEDTLVKGRMTASLTVSSDCEDTCFYVRLSLCKEEGDLGLRDDITKISNVDPAYIPGEEITLSFTFDEHAFLIQKGEKLRIDVSSSAFPHYVRHTNNRGHFALQTTMKVATNTVFCDRSSLTIPVETA